MALIPPRHKIGNILTQIPQKRSRFNPHLVISKMGRQNIHYPFPFITRVIIIIMFTAATTSTLSSLTRSSLPLLRSPHLSRFAPNLLRKSLQCPLYSASFSFCLHPLPTKSTSPPKFFCSAPMAAATAIGSNPLLQDFAFPPFDVVEAKHVKPGVLELLRTLVRVFG